MPGGLPRGGVLQTEEDEEKEGWDDLRGRNTVSGTARTHSVYLTGNEQVQPGEHVLKLSEVLNQLLASC